MTEYIKIQGARTNNLKNVDVNIKVNKITCICGPSGSGKSSLAFHTLQAESKRRFINSFPSSQRFFEEIPQKPDVDVIEPVLPVWSLPQNNPVLGSRMNVVDLLDLETGLEKLFYIYGSPICPKHEEPLTRKSISEQIADLKLKGKILYVFLSKEDFVLNSSSSIFPARSYNSVEQRINSFDKDDNFWEVFRIKIEKLEQLSKKLEENKLLIKKSSLYLCTDKNEKKLIEFQSNNTRSCSKCGYQLEHEFTSPVHLSPFTGVGSCMKCNGYGAQLVYSREKLVKEPHLSINEGAISVMNFSRFNHLIPQMKKCFRANGISLTKPFEELPEKKWEILFEGGASYPGLDYLLEYLESKKYKKNIRIYVRGLQKEVICDECMGTRLNNSAFNYLFDNVRLGNLLKMSINQAVEVFGKIILNNKKKFSNQFLSLLTSVQNKLKIADEIGLSHLNLNSKVKYLQASEYQRLLLVKYFSYEGSGSLFIFDEPSLGLDPDEQKKAIKYINELKSQGNTVLVVDHSKEFQKSADEIIEMGPGAGFLGGEIVYQGKYRALKTGKIQKVKRDLNNYIYAKKIKGIEGIDSIKLPLNVMTWVTGSSGSHKREVVVSAVANNISKTINGKKLEDKFFDISSITGIGKISNIELFTSQSLKANSRSTVGTYIGLNSYIRKKFTQSPVAKSLLLKDGHFSPNSALGACPTCEGRGVLVVDMKFLENVVYTCPDCNGMKLRPLYGNIEYNDISFHDAVNNPIVEVFKKFETTPKIKRILELLNILNLDYLTMDRTLVSLSGGEQQRLKLLSFLVKSPENSILFFENISFGLSEFELFKITAYFEKLLDIGNTIVVIDPNPIFEKLSHHRLVF